MKCSVLPLVVVLVAASALAVDVPLGNKDFVPTPARPIGWRGDGTGCFAGATPGTDYSPTGPQFLWKTETPSWGNGSPIVVGKIVVITCEPDLVIACDAQTGKQLWQADSAWTEGLPKEQADAAKAALAGIVSGDKDAGAKFSQFKLRIPDDFHAFGFAVPTPASDGTRIYVKCSTGTLCAYDLTGKRLWRHVDPAMNANPVCNSSPLIIDGKVAYLAPDGGEGTVAVTALDAATGKKVWQTKGVAHAGYRASASPVAMQVGTTKLIATPGGDILRASDGKRLAEKVQPAHLGSSPVAIGDIVYGLYEIAKKPLSSAQRIALSGEQITATALFSSPRAGWTVASPLIAQGTMFTVSNGGINLYDAATGAELPFPTRVKMTGNGHTFWPSPALAGNQVVLALNGGEVHVFAAGKEWKPIATSVIDPMSASPFFQGSRSYFRTNKALYCFGAK